MAIDTIETPSSTLSDRGFFLFMKGFSSISCEEAIRFIMEKNFLPKDKRPKNLTIVINSPGGDVQSCFALIDTIKGSIIPVHTVGLGMIASCGLLLFMSGVKGHRVITPNTSILSHQYSWGSFGKEHELFATVKEFSLTSKRILEHYKKCTGLSEKIIINELLPAEDVWLDGSEAIRYKLADRIVETY